MNKLLIPLDSISTADNIRSDLTEIERLAASIREVGQRTPIEVVEIGDGAGTYTLLTGHRRLAALRLAGVDTAWCTVVAGDGPGTRPALQLAENAHVALTPMDEAAAFAAARDAGDDVETIARASGRSATHVRSMLRVARLPAETLARLRMAGAPARVLIACAAKGADTAAIIGDYERKAAALAAAGRKRAASAPTPDDGELESKPSRISSAAIRRILEALEAGRMTTRERRDAEAVATVLRWVLGEASAPTIVATIAVRIEQERAERIDRDDDDDDDDGE